MTDCKYYLRIKVHSGVNPTQRHYIFSTYKDNQEHPPSHCEMNPNGYDVVM